MKKLGIVFLILLLVCSLAACGKPAPLPGDETAPPPNETVDTEDPAMHSLIQWMIGGTFSYDFEMTSTDGGQSVTSTGSIAMDGGNIAIQTTSAGTTSRIIIKDGVCYIILDDQKLMMKMEGIGADETGGIMTDYSGIEKTGEGTGEINGKTLPYEEYTESETGAAVRYYIDGNQVYGIESTYEGYVTVMIITNAKNSVPSGVFDLPVGYTEM